MDFGLSDEQRMLVETVRRFVDTELIPLEEDVERNGRLEPSKAREIFEKSMALGFYAMNIPEQYGGGGLSAVDTMLAEEQFGHTKDILIRRAFGNVYESLLEGDDEQKKRWLLPAVRGERTCSIAITEPGAGSDAAGIATRAVRDGDGWVLNGNKHFVSDGEYSDFFIVSAVTSPDARPRHISLFLVDKATPGVTVGPNQPMMGLAGTSHVGLFFDDVRLSAQNLLGGEGRGLRIALETLGRVRLAQVCARAVGKSSRLLRLATDYANERRQFGKPIGDFQMIQQMIADSVIDINGARLIVLRAAWEIDQGRDGRDWISMAKVEAAETLGRVADRAVQIFGGMGYCAEMPIERLYRDSRIYRIFDGTSEIHRTVVARSALKNGAPVFDIAAAA
jgi:acyl-CoA dehydrogenase